MAALSRDIAENIDEKELQFDELTYNWIDITNDFFSSVQSLELGELLHDELFGLFEAMSAIEMMDPKMDAGMLCNRGNNKPYSFKQAVDSGAIKLDNLSQSEVIGIIDSTYSCIVSWLEGHSLAQTVFTNLYLHQPGQILDKSLRTFCYAIYKIIEIIKDCINKAMVFEEEDFQSVTYGYRLQQDITEQKTIAMLREVEEELHRKSRIKPVDDESNREYNDALALYARIRFTKMFYQTLSLMGRKEQLQQNLSGCQRLLSNCSDMMQVMLKTVYRGVKADESSDHPNIMGFDPMVNQRLLPPTFPRYTKIKPRSEALEYIDELLNRLKTVSKITGYTGFHGALDFFLEFSRQSPCILSRSMLQIVYLPLTNRVFGTQSFGDVLRDAARAFIAPPALMPKITLLQNHQAKDYVDGFLGHCVCLFGSLVQLSGHNRARQRDKLAHLLEDFAALQDEAERVDSYLHTLSLKSDMPRPHLACFGTWILYHTLRVMVMYLLSGFELELYSVHEYHYIFWYLYEFLYGWLVSAITRADSLLMEQDIHTETHKGRGAKKSAKNKKKKSTPRPYSLEILMYQAMQNICGGYYKALVGFRMDKKIPLPESQFDSERVRYEHRLLPFASLLTPPPVHYQEFLDMTTAQMLNREETVTSEMQYLAGCRHFHQARNMLESALSLYPANVHTVNEINDLLKVSKTNFIVLKLLAGGHKRDSTEPPIFDFSCHQHFPLIKLAQIVQAVRLESWRQNARTDKRRYIGKCLKDFFEPDKSGFEVDLCIFKRWHGFHDDEVKKSTTEDMVVVVEVEVEDRTIKKPFLGGWRHKVSGVEYLNANSQTGPRTKKVPWSSLCTQPIQTVETKTRFTETSVNRATQMWRKDCYIPNVSDTYIVPRPYESYERMQSKLNIEGRVKMIQKYYRAYRIAKLIKESAATHRQMVADCKRHEEERILAYKRRHQHDIIRKTYPLSRSDFDMLYNLMDQWKHFQMNRVASLFFKGAQRAASVTLLNKSVEMLKDIDRQKRYIKTEFLERRNMEFLTSHCAPVKWSGYKAKTTQMVTVKVQRARELKRLHDNLTRRNISAEERTELIVMLKNSLSNHHCYAVNELVYLLDQEIELTSRGIKKMWLTQLRRRIKNAFLYFVQNSENCTCKLKDDFISRDPNCEELRVPLETNMLFCRRCFRLLPYHRFSAHVRMKKILFCSACESLVVGKQARINYSLFTYLLNGIRADEMKRNCFSSLIFVMREPGIYHLVNNIWHGRSIISENDDLYKLRLGRFDINVEWSPWNCVLLTEEEAEAHYYIKDFRTVYAQSLLDKIFLIQEQAKSHFRELVIFEKHFRESSRFYMVQQRKEYKAPRPVESYAPYEMET